MWVTWAVASVETPIETGASYPRATRTTQPGDPMPPIRLIAGPTASGKSALDLRLLTARPSAEEEALA